MQNHLAKENSPYLLQHADNPVNWYPWGKEALEKAFQDDKPIFLSIGYAACHWCHVMAHESFEDPKTASLMNQYFVNIKVDREERPDLDNIYMQAVTALTGQGGWPMSVFLTPQGKPFYGGTYFPPIRRYQMPAFSEILETIARLWQSDRQQLLNSADKITQHLVSIQPSIQPDTTLSKTILEEASFSLVNSYDWKYGGWGKSPKFPQPMAIEFLLRRAAVGEPSSLELAKHALESMSKGGIYDVIGGGFARYSTDDQWLVPHFEKMLYDNAQLARVYLYVYLLTENKNYRRVCEKTLDFMKRELWQSIDGDLPINRHELLLGGFASSLDADSEGIEGKFYLWSEEEIISALDNFEPSSSEIKQLNLENTFTDNGYAQFYLSAYGITKTGNFDGVNILQKTTDDSQLSESFKIPEQAVPDLLEILNNHLLEQREKRIRPGKDDKVITAWNGLVIQSFAEAARYLKRRDYLEIAQGNAKFLLKYLHHDNRLLRSWRKGKAQHNAYLEDYASLGLALLVLYQSDPDPFWFHSAEKLAQEMINHFRDPNGGFFDTRDDHDPLLLRPKEIQDNATPSGNALACQFLLELAAFSGKGYYRDQAEKMLGSILSFAISYPTAFARWLCALDFALAEVKEVAILGEAGEPETLAMVNAVWSQYRPHLVLAQSGIPPSDNSPALLLDRPLVDGKSTAYVCQGFVCKQPLTDSKQLYALLQKE